jgi:hypothetical protein
LVRDLSLLEIEYDIKFVQPVDMFPWTRTCWVRINSKLKKMSWRLTNLNFMV